MGIERVRFRRPVHPGDIVEIEAVVKRLRSRMGVLSGAARVDGKVVVRRHDDVRTGAERRGPRRGGVTGAFAAGVSASAAGSR